MHFWKRNWCNEFQCQAHGEEMSTSGNTRESSCLRHRETKTDADDAQPHGPNHIGKGAKKSRMRASTLAKLPWSKLWSKLWLLASWSQGRKVDSSLTGNLAAFSQNTFHVLCHPMRWRGECSEDPVHECRLRKSLPPNRNWAVETSAGCSRSEVEPQILQRTLKWAKYASTNKQTRQFFQKCLKSGRPFQS